ncbi:hypothetical protein C8A00DRAFT_28982 [Chaetomidium leptoderma]|uniref:CFEM domain-containing protein n=1 Tax=Chaetomidium leptoderma TaxID=669021 RepID=A0AAN6VUU3_9PEZI|nr:hypothetical protein C8A00DRAFT_28982 [Chaetomidium leptoderma]
MKVPAALLSLALASAVIAQGTPELPTCAQKCADGFLSGGIGNCGNDPTCICSNKDFLSSISCCLVDACDAPAQSEAMVFASRLCRGFSVTDLPTAVVCASTTGAAATTTSAGSATTKATGAGSTSSPAPTSTGAAATESANDSTNDSSSSSSSSSESTNFGPRPTAAAGLGAIGGILAAVALL